MFVSSVHAHLMAMRTLLYQNNQKEILNSDDLRLHLAKINLDDIIPRKNFRSKDLAKRKEFPYNRPHENFGLAFGVNKLSSSENMLHLAYLGNKPKSKHPANSLRATNEPRRAEESATVSFSARSALCGIVDSCLQNSTEVAAELEESAEDFGLCIQSDSEELSDSARGWIGSLVSDLMRSPLQNVHRDRNDALFEQDAEQQEISPSEMELTDSAREWMKSFNLSILSQAVIFDETNDEVAYSSERGENDSTHATVKVCNDVEDLELMSTSARRTILDFVNDTMNCAGKCADDFLGSENDACCLNKVESGEDQKAPSVDPAKQSQLGKSSHYKQESDKRTAFLASVEGHLSGLRAILYRGTAAGGSINGVPYATVLPKTTPCDVDRILTAWVGGSTGPIVSVARSKHHAQDGRKLLRLQNTHQSNQDELSGSGIPTIRRSAPVSNRLLESKLPRFRYPRSGPGSIESNRKGKSGPGPQDPQSAKRAGLPGLRHSHPIQYNSTRIAAAGGFSRSLGHRGSNNRMPPLPLAATFASEACAPLQARRGTDATPESRLVCGWLSQGGLRNGGKAAATRAAVAC